MFYVISSLLTSHITHPESCLYILNNMKRVTWGLHWVTVQQADLTCCCAMRLICVCTCVCVCVRACVRACHTHTQGGSESPSGCQNNVLIGTTVSTGAELHFHSVELFCVLGHSGVTCRWNFRQACKSVGPEPALRKSRQDIRRKIKRWMDNQHITMCRGLVSTQRETRKMILYPTPTAKTRLLL